MKNYTDIEQSKKLAEILPIESADACWTNHMFGSLLSSWRIESTQPQEYKHLLDRFIVGGYLIEPAWSLVALFSVLEHPRCFQGNKPIYWFCGCFGKDKLYHEVEADNPIDACYELILKLHELNLL